ncbi:MAG: hypothetical protein M1530_00105 [Candidatus Marsarchaeota archaeon]|nr:hypothetical protein [Candidatus Marsarchaeota archaeon]
METFCADLKKGNPFHDAIGHTIENYNIPEEYHRALITSGLLSPDAYMRVSALGHVCETPGLQTPDIMVRAKSVLQRALEPDFLVYSYNKHNAETKKIFNKLDLVFVEEYLPGIVEPIRGRDDRYYVTKNKIDASRLSKEEKEILLVLGAKKGLFGHVSASFAAVGHYLRSKKQLFPDLDLFKRARSVVEMFLEKARDSSEVDRALDLLRYFPSKADQNHIYKKALEYCSSWANLPPLGRI